MDLSELIESIDIVEFISQFVDLKERNGEFWGLSPFKEEKTPSFSVRKEAKRFYDFSSGIGGNVFTFIKYYKKCSSKEAVDALKAYVGDAATELSACVNVKLPATIMCKKFLPASPTYKKQSGTILPQNCMEKYEDRQDKLDVWKQEGISDETLRKYSVKYDAFSDRLVYPIKNLNGDIVNIGGRTLDNEWKAKGLRKYTYFYEWGVMNIVYGLFDNMDAILRQHEVILFEGCKSVLIANTWGIHNTGALLTSHLNPAQMKILARLGVNVVFALDKEVNILKDHNINKLKRYVNVYQLRDTSNLTEEKDSPVDKGVEIFTKLYDSKKLIR